MTLLSVCVRFVELGGFGCIAGSDVPDNLAVNGAGNAVLELQVHLGDGVVGEDGSIRDIT